MKPLKSGLAFCLSLLLPLWVNAGCVPPLAKPDTIYLDNNNGTVTDNETGLIWMKCPLGLSDSACSTGTASQLNWKDALLQAEAFYAVGKGDWRLPNAKELASLLDRSCESAAINGTFFPATPSGEYWTSSPASQSADSALSVDFTTGAMGEQPKNTANYIRLVRGGY